MTNQDFEILAARLRGLAKDAIAIAELLEAQAPSHPASDPVQRSGDGSIYVTLPGPDLFSEIERAEEAERIREALPQIKGTPQRRERRNIATRMTEHLSVSTTSNVGKAEGFCIRNDIERRVADITGRSREDVREAVNRIAERMQITCVKSRSYRYYPRSLRAKIINEAVELLKAS